jgi:hypothetical protein
VTRTGTKAPVGTVAVAVGVLVAVSVAVGVTVAVGDEVEVGLAITVGDGTDVEVTVGSLAAGPPATVGTAEAALVAVGDGTTWVGAERAGVAVAGVAAVAELAGWVEE